MVVDRTSTEFGVWTYFIQIISSLTCFTYPCIAAFGMENVTWVFAFEVLYIIEFFILIDMCLQFFVSFRDESSDYNRQERDFFKTSKNYFYGNFSIDLLTFIPFGLLSQIEGFHQLELLWLIKIIRIQHLMEILDEKYVGPFLREYYQKKLLLLLQDKKFVEDKNRDHSKISSRIKVQGIMKLLRTAI